MTASDESLSMGESSTNLLIDQPPRFTLRSYFPRSDSNRELVGGCCLCLLLVMMFFAITVVFPIKLIMAGSTNTAYCPIQTKLPIFLIISGVVPLVSIVLCVGIVSIKLADTLYILGVLLFYIEFLLHMFWLSWMVLGIVWMIDLTESVQYTNTSLPTYCDKNTFATFSIYLPAESAFAIISICTSMVCCWLSKL